jgi:hypothetical protein
MTAMAALLGGGAYMITDRVTTSGAATTDVGALASAGSATPGMSTSLASGAPASDRPQSGAASETSQVSETPPSAAQSISPEVRKSIDVARERMRKDGVEVQRPVTPPVPQTADNIQTTTKGSLKAGGIVRILAAREDLTGQRELAYVAGGVQKYRNVPCSQTFQFSTTPAPAKKDNLLMCWRTTATKSVVAIVVDPKGKPSREKAVAAIEQKWRSMA